MKTNYMIKYSGLLLLFVVVVFCLASCGKDDYYIDGGKAEAKFDGDIIQYLESKPKDFDTIAQIIKIAGLEDVFKKETITFFAPNDQFIKAAIKRLNTDLNNRFVDTVKVLTDIEPEIWSKYILRYVFKGANKMADYPQIDLQLLSTFPGQTYLSYNSTVFNIGVIYNDANGVKYVGARELALHFIPDVSKPKDNWTRALISSSNIQPTNGVVHALAYDRIDFGFSYNEFYQDVLLSK